MVFVTATLGCKPIDDYLQVGNKFAAADLSPIAVLENAPSGASNTSTLAVSVTGASVISYRHKVGAASTTDCAIEAGYSTTAASTSAPISDSVASVPEGMVTLCVLATSSMGIEQRLSSATMSSWTKDITPPTLSYAAAGGDFIDASTQSAFLLNGTCSDEGRTIAISGSITTTATCASGAWSKNVDLSSQSDGPLTLNFNLLDAAGNSATPVTANVAKDTGPTAFISFSKLDNSIIEADTATSFTVQTTVAKLYDTQVSYILSGTATTGVDHDLAGGSVTLPAGQTSATVNFNIINNALVESERRLVVSLAKSNRTNVKLGTAASQMIDIQDDDSGAYNTLLSVSAGQGSSTCVVFTGGALKCWGQNNYGQLGDGTMTDRTSPVPIDAGTSYAAVVNGGGPSACGLTSAGVVKCWGWNGGGQLGDGSTSQRLAPSVTDGGAIYKSVVGGSGPHHCGINAADQLRCWGYNPYGQIGDGSISTRATPATIDSVTYKSVSIGANHTCGVTTGGVLKCWGDNSAYQLGDGTTTASLTPKTVDAGTLYLSVVSGSNNNCAITTGHALKCWGNNFSGQLGNGTTTALTTPTPIDVGTSYFAAAASAAGGYTCGITTGYSLKCWGTNAYGQLGDGTKVSSLVPIVIDPATTYNFITISGDHACAVPVAGGLKCWGSNSGSQVSAKPSYEVVPVQVNAATTYTSLSRADRHSCAVATGGSLSCWGDNSAGQIGDGSTTPRISAVAIDPKMTYATVSVARAHSCGITTSGALKCWGENAYGQLGDGTIINRLSPITIDSPTKFTRVATALRATCAITTAGVLKCWGDNSGSQLGDGTATNRLSPAIIDTGTTYSEVSVSRNFACGITTSKALKCWGTNAGSQLGDGTVTTRTTPTPIDALTAYAKISTSKSEFGNYTSCAVTDGGALKCWGDNSFGQIGDGTVVNRATPTPVDAGTSFSSVAYGYLTACATTTGGLLKCWGYNSQGEIGDGSTTARGAPVLVDGGTNYLEVKTAYETSCGITTAGALKCWGDTADGLFSRADRTIMPTPISNLFAPPALTF